MIATNGVRPAGMQVAWCATVNRDAFVVDNANLVGRTHGNALGPDDLIDVAAQFGVIHEPLGHAKDLLEINAQLRGDAFGGRGAEFRATNPDRFHGFHRGVGNVGLVAAVEEANEQRRDQRHVRAPVRVNVATDGGGRRVGNVHHRGADMERTQDAGRAHREVVRRRHDHKKHIATLHITHLVGAANGIQIVIVAARDQLRCTRRASGELEEGKGLGVAFR